MPKLRKRLGPDGVAQQFAALPFRRDEAGAVQVLLLSSRETRRWVIPKGWPMRKLSAPAAAAREAYEEAGLEGTIEEEPVGTYRYDKRLDDGTTVPVRVIVFRLAVARQLPAWPEQGQRQTRWCDPEEAAGLVAEPELAEILRGMIGLAEARSRGAGVAYPRTAETRARDRRAPHRHD